MYPPLIARTPLRLFALPVIVPWFSPIAPRSKYIPIALLPTSSIVPQFSALERDPVANIPIPSSS